MSATPAEIVYQPNTVACAMPLKMETYKACDHGCIYCRTKMGHKTSHQRAIFEARPLDKLIRQLSFQSITPASPYIKQKMVVQWGTTCDPFPHRELTYKNTFNAMKIMMKYGQPFQINTKAIYPSQEPYFSMLKEYKEHCSFRFSMPMVDKYAKAIEINSPRPKERWAAIDKMRNAGIPVGIYIGPYINQEISMGGDMDKFFKMCAERVDYVGIALIECHKAATRTWDVMFKRLGFKGGYAEYMEDKKSKTKVCDGSMYLFADDWIRQQFQEIHDCASSHGVNINFGGYGMFHGLDLSKDKKYCCRINKNHVVNNDALFPMFKEDRMKKLKYVEDDMDKPDNYTDLILENIIHYKDVVKGMRKWKGFESPVFKKRKKVLK